MSELTPCFGYAGCEQHAACGHYHALETSDSKVRWGHCPVDASGRRTLFVPMFITHGRAHVERRAANGQEREEFDRRISAAIKEAA